MHCAYTYRGKELATLLSRETVTFRVKYKTVIRIKSDTHDTQTWQVEVIIGRAQKTMHVNLAYRSHIFILVHRNSKSKMSYYFLGELPP